MLDFARSGGKHKYKLISEYLRTQIVSGRYKQGQTLPSQQKLMAQYNVSLSTVRQSLRELAKEGWIRPEHGRGVFVQDPRTVECSEDRQVKKITSVGFALLYKVADDPVYMMILRGAAEVLQEYDRTLAFATFDPDDPQDDKKLAQFSNGLSALIVAGWVDEQRLYGLVKPDQPVVIAGNVAKQCEQKHISTISIAAESAGYLAAQMLIMHGHRQMALISKSGSKGNDDVEAGFRRAGREAQQVESQVFRAENVDGKEQLAQQISQQDQLTGLVVIGDGRACRFIRFLGEYGCSVPEDKSIVSIGGLPRESLTRPDLSRINVGYKQVGEQAARLMMHYQCPLTNRVLPVRVEQGQTIASVNGLLGATEIGSEQISGPG